MRIEDREPVGRVLAGEIDDFRVLVERHQRAIFRFALGLLGNREEAQDIAQEAFLAAYANLSSYDSSRGAFSTWLFTIARNRCINALKRNHPDALQTPDAIQGNTMADPLDRQELSQQLDRALAALPVEQRSAFVLAEIEETEAKNRGKTETLAPECLVPTLLGLVSESLPFIREALTLQMMHHEAHEEHEA